MRGEGEWKKQARRVLMFVGGGGSGREREGGGRRVRRGAVQANKEAEEKMTTMKQSDDVKMPYISLLEVAM